ncbi:MAG: fasciclin domain-containing protein [Cyanobacteria bacterium P01_H01_bin.121]
MPSTRLLVKSLVLASALSIGLTANGEAESLTVAAGRHDVRANAASTAVTLVAQATGDIVDVAAANPEFSTLVQAVQAAGLVDTLKGTGPFTIFAPTNAAFSNLPAGALDALLLPENQDLLTDVLLYHVVAGDVRAADLRTGKVESLNGGLAVSVTPERVVVNNASVIQPDIDASNGVIHVINRVLIPIGLVQQLEARSQTPVRALW